jgi:hypothetical protein
MDRIFKILIDWQEALWQQISGDELEEDELHKAKERLKAVSECILILNDL